MPWASLRHPIDCATTGLGIRIEDVRYADITGDGKLDALVQVICETSTSAGSDQVEVFDGSSSPQQPESIGVLLKVTDPEGTKHQVKKLSVSGRVVTATYSEWTQPTSPNCCPDTTTVQTFEWNGTGFKEGLPQRTPSGTGATPTLPPGAGGPDNVPADVTRCNGGSWEGHVGVGPNTTCDFGNAVNQAWQTAGYGTRTVTASSPLTGKSYQMNCVQSSDINAAVVCAGGNNAVVYLY